MKNLYTVVDPVPELRRYIRKWFVADCSEPVEYTSRLIPTGYGYFGWVFRGANQLRVNGDWREPVSSSVIHIAGHVSAADDVRLTYRGAFGHVMAEFTAIGFYELLPVDLGDFSGIGHVLLPNEASWVEPLIGAAMVHRGTTSSKIELLENFLIDRIGSARVAPDYVCRLASEIELNAGTLVLSEMIERINVPVSHRHLARKFTEVVGLSPKRFARTIQLAQAIEALISQNQPELARIAQEAGFYDQSHFNRAMQECLEHSPQRFLNGKSDFFTEFLKP